MTEAAATVTANGVVHQPNAPAPTNPAMAQITALKRDTAFTQRLLAGDVAARTTWDAAHQAAAGETASAPAPTERINALKQDPDFGRRLAAGDVAARTEWDAAHQAAGPEAPAAGIEGFEPGKAHQFDIGAHFKNDRGEVDAAGHAGHIATAGWLEAMQIPAPNGSFAIKAVAEHAPRWAQMDEPARVQHADGVRAKLNQMWGPEQAAARVEMARLLVKEVEAKKPGFVAMLEKSGAVSELTTIVQMGLHAERMFAKRGITIDAVMAKLKKGT